MSVAEFFSQPVWHRLGLTLVHFLWQGLAIAVIAYAAVRVLALKRGNPRYTAYLLAFTVLAVCPLITFMVLGVPARPAGVALEQLPQVESSPPAPRSASSETLQQRAENTPYAGPTRSVPLGERLEDAFQASLPWALACWMAGVLILSVRLLLGSVGLCRWRRNLEPLPNELKSRAALLAERLGLSRLCRIFMSRHAREPAALGYLRPLVLMPTAMVTAMPTEMLEAIIAHELAHIRRYDLWVNLAQRVVETLLFYHPAVWWLSNRLRAERELCCDELAVRATGERLTYASALESAGRARLAARQPALAVALGRDGKSTLGRVRHVLGLPPAPADSRPWLAGVVAVAVLAVLTAPATWVLAARAEPSTSTAGAGNRVASLHDAVDLGNVNEAKRLIAAGADVNAKNEQGFTPLSWGIISPGERIKEVPELLIEVAELLIDAGADVNARGGPERMGETRTPLHWATFSITKGSEIVRLLVDRGANVNLTAERGWTPLHFAVVKQNMEAVRLLVAKGADFNLKNQEGWTAFSGAALRGRTDMTELFLRKGTDRSGFHMAAFTGNLSRVKELVEAGTDVNAKDEFGWTALFWAACAGQTTVAEFLIENKADLAAQDASGHSLLHQAARTRTNAVKLVELLIAKGADVNAKSAGGDTPLHLACYSDVATLLIAKGADVNAKDRSGYTPLHAAAAANHLEVAELLILKGADVNAKSGGGFTLLDDAVIMGHTDMVRLLIDKGADVNVNTRVGTPLYLAVMGGHTDIVELLITKGADINAKHNNGWTPLRLAESKGHIQSVELLRKHGAKEDSSVGQSDARPATSLQRAVTSGNIDQVKSLISQGADVNAKNEQGQTLLHLACQRGNTETAKLLINGGANLNAKNDRGQTPFDVACIQGHKAAAEYLLEKGAAINNVTHEGGTPLVLAAYAGHRDIVEWLVSKGCDMEHRNIWGNTPVSEAAYCGKLDVAQLLLEKGARVDEENYYEDTPLHRAILSGHIPTVQLLLDHGAKLKRGRLGFTPVGLAMLENQSEMLKFLIDKKSEYSPAHLAAFRGDVEAIKDSLARGGDINAQDPSGLTLLACAICSGQIRVVEFLLSSGADINLVDGSHFTALQWATARRRPKIVALLLEKNADVGIRDDHGYTALHWAAMKGSVEIVQMLLKKGSPVNAESGVMNTQGGKDARWTPLHNASDAAQPQVVEVLLANGANINARTSRGDTPLARARELYGVKGTVAYRRTVELLQQRGAKE